MDIASPFYVQVIGDPLLFDSTVYGLGKAKAFRGTQIARVKKKSSGVGEIQTRVGEICVFLRGC
jgi:hypothetical protein